MAQGDLNTTSYVILGLLASRDWSAYEMAAQVGRGVAGVWPRAERQRYYAPKRLVEQGMVTARTEATGKRRRTVYSITPAGRRALEQWLTTTPHPSSLESEGMIRVMLAERGTIEDLRASLRIMGDQAREQLAVSGADAGLLLGSEGGTFSERGHLMGLANRFMVDHFTHMLAWVDWALDEIETWPDTITPAVTHHHRSRAILAASADHVGDAPDPS